MESGARRPAILHGILLPVLLIATVVAGGWAAARWIGGDTDLAEAMLRDLPRQTVGVNAVDWEQMRDQLGDDSLLDDAHQYDFTTVSMVAPYESEFTSMLGFDARRIRWELNAVTSSGAVLMVGLPGGESDEKVEDALRDFGYSGSDRLDISDPKLIELGVGELRLLGFAEVRDGVLYAAEKEPALDDVLAAHEGTVVRLAGGPLAQVITALDNPIALSTVRGRDACDARDPAQAGFELRGQVNAALEKAGELGTYDWYGQAVTGEEGREMRLAMGFASAGIAAEQAAVREQLSSGPFIGRSGNVEDKFKIRGSAWDGPVAMLDFERIGERPPLVMTGTGPMLFAACR